jgi:hypothetical protein
LQPELPRTAEAGKQIPPYTVMAGLVLAIHVLRVVLQDVDARTKSGHDVGGWQVR